jgi:hypothetical protein
MAEQLARVINQLAVQLTDFADIIHIVMYVFLPNP